MFTMILEKVCILKMVVLEMVSLSTHTDFCSVLQTASTIMTEQQEKIKETKNVVHT